MSAAGRRTIAVYVVLAPQTLLLDVAGPLEVLRKANDHQHSVRFETRFIGPMSEVKSSVGLTLSNIEPLPDKLPANAFIMVPGGIDASDPGPGAKAASAVEEKIVAWLRETIKPDHTLISICAGALLAGRAGLLDDHFCTTHHACSAELSKLAPRAKILENRLYVEDGQRLTSAGVTAGIDLMLHLVSRLIDTACAVRIARALVIYLRRAGADPQLSPWLEGRNHLHSAVHRVQDAIAAEPARDWKLEDAAAIAQMSPRHLSRLFNEQAGMSLADYTNRVRIALAGELLKQTRLDIERVAERTGFASPRQFRRAWGRYHPLPPSQVRSTV
ncbi:MAG: helix-turn-helix domain-containing protein [Bradyrhizobium sp.]